MTALAEKATSTDLVVIDSDLAGVERVLGQLTEAGDTHGLHQLANEAQAYALYNKRNRSKEQADYFSRIKVQAEAGIGIIDLHATAWRGHATREHDLGELVIREHRFSWGTRTIWRLVGIGQMRGLLNGAFEELAHNPEQQISSAQVYKVLLRNGAAWMPRQQLRDAVRNSELSMTELAHRTGVSRNNVHNLCRDSDRQAVRWLSAFPILRAVGTDPTTMRVALPPNRNCGQARLRNQAAKRALRNEQRAKAAERHGGNIHEAYSLLRKCAQVLDPAEHDFTTKEAKAHVRSAYSALRRAEDEIAQALGVA